MLNAQSPFVVVSAEWDDRQLPCADTDSGHYIVTYRYVIVSLKEKSLSDEVENLLGQIPMFLMINEHWFQIMSICLSFLESRRHDSSSITTSAMFGLHLRSWSQQRFAKLHSSSGNAQFKAVILALSGRKPVMIAKIICPLFVNFLPKSGGFPV